MEISPPELLFDDEEFNRWIQQAEHTLQSAQRDTEAGDHAWACFKAQQAAEYAVKALMRGFGLAAIGHSILRLLREAKEDGLELPPEAEQQARQLDRHYIPPRYPDAYPAGSPFEFYDEATAQKVIAAARWMLAAIREARGTYG